MPTPEGPAPRWVAKSGRTGLFEIVELKIARKPVMQRVKKGRELSLSLCIKEKQQRQSGAQLLHRDNCIETLLRNCTIIAFHS